MLSSPGDKPRARSGEAPGGAPPKAEVNFDIPFDNWSPDDKLSDSSQPRPARSAPGASVLT